MENGTKFGAVETELGWVGVAVGPKGLRFASLPVRKQSEALDAIAGHGGEPVAEADLGPVADAVRDIVSGRPYENGVELDAYQVDFGDVSVIAVTPRDVAVPMRLGIFRNQSLERGFEYLEVRDDVPAAPELFQPPPEIRIVSDPVPAP